MTDGSRTPTAPGLPDAVNIRLVTAISCVATLGGFLFGFDSGVINGTVDGLQAAFQSSTAGTGFNVASMLLGCAVGAFFAGRLADMLGRRTLMILAAMLFIVSAWGSGIATGSLEFVLYRLIGGFAVGAASVMSPAYISEVAPASIRGRLITIQQIAIIVGLTTAFLSNFLLAGAAGASTKLLLLDYEAWRWMFWMEIIPATTFLVLLFAIPESPRFLMIKQRQDEALRVLTRLFGAETAARKVEDIQATIAEDHRPRLADLIDPATRRVRSIVWVGIGLASFQQLVGINVVFYYGAVLWQAAGFSESDALLTNVIMGTVSIASCLVSLMLIDKIGRKPLLMIGSVGMAVTLAIVAYVFSTGTFIAEGTVIEAGTVLANGTLFETRTIMAQSILDLDPTSGVIALVTVITYAALFNFSWGPVMWVMLGEMFPNQIRGSGLAVSGLFQWGANFAVTMTFPVFLALIGLSGSYGLYTVFAVISVFFIARAVHETRGLELEDMPG